MKKKIIIANWKMSLGPKQTLNLTEALLKKCQAEEQQTVEVVICPSFIILNEVSQKIANSKIALGAQNCFWHEEGAFTGEVSPSSLKDFGCEYVILGHSERRGYLKETDKMVNQKVGAAIKNHLIPIVCIGETFEERQAGNKDFIIMQQINRALEGIELSNEQQLIVAYEPVWVIGSGQAVEPLEAEHTNQVIRHVMLDHFSLETINKQIRFIYGGSVSSENINLFMAQPTVEGALVGGASLEAETFYKLIKAAM